jgi:hypothetical protein
MKRRSTRSSQTRTPGALIVARAARRRRISPEIPAGAILDAAVADVSAASRARSIVLAGYHYTAVSLRRMVRHCFDPLRPPGEEFNLHPDGDAELRAHGFIAAEDAARA